MILKVAWLREPFGEDANFTVFKLEKKLFRSQFYLAEIYGQVDFFVLKSTGKRRTLPPLGRTVDRIFGWVDLAGLASIADIASLTVDD